MTAGASASPAFTMTVTLLAALLTGQVKLQQHKEHEKPSERATFSVKGRDEERKDGECTGFSWGAIPSPDHQDLIQEG